MPLPAFFFLLRPGERCCDKQSSHPLQLQGVSFQAANGTAANAVIINNKELAIALTARLKFMGQKSGGKGKAAPRGGADEELVTPLKAT